MANAVQDPVIENASYAVRLSNDVTSTGVVVLTVSWVPLHGMVVPTPQHAEISPGSTVTLTGKVPLANNARTMVVVVTVGPEETVQLSLSADDAMVARENVTETTVWESVVVKAGA